jgi:hypothetical protein
MRKGKKSKAVMKARAESLKSRGFGISSNGKKLDPKSREYQKVLEGFLESVGPDELKPRKPTC